MDEVWDVAVLGSGLGGLSAALSVAHAGDSVLILEKGISPGGCASSFQKSGFIFESGATTLVGLEPNYPMDDLCKRYGIQFPVLPLSIPMVVHIDGNNLVRYEDQTEWTSEVIRVFGKPKRQTLFWRFLFFLSKNVWNLSSRYRNFPFSEVRDIWKTLLVFSFKDLIPLFLSFFPLRFFIFVFGLLGDKKFIQFLDEQLLITCQSTTENTPTPMAAAGLTYPNLKNYYVLGGMVSLANTIIEKVEALSMQNKILYKQEVIQIQRVDRENLGRIWEILTKHRETNIFYAKEIISNLPIWNLAPLIETKKALHKANQFEKKIWGAFTMGIAIRWKIDTILTSLHYQIHLENPLPYGGGSSIFVSVSHPEDGKRSNNGSLVLSVSTHIEEPETWTRDESYQKKKNEIELRILDALSKHLSWFDSELILFKHSATPVTWKTWTGRKFGRVGGIPSFYFLNPFRYLSNRLDGVYLTGDTVYPGQGIPAVVLGGQLAAERYLNRKRG